MINLLGRLVLKSTRTKMDKFSFLVTTDNHMGFKEDDHIRREYLYRFTPTHWG